MPLLENAYDPVLTPNVYLENKQADLVYPPIKPFDIELTPSVVQNTQVPDNYRAAFDALDKMKKTPFVPVGDSFGTKDTNVFGVQNMAFEYGADNEGLAALKQDNVLSKGFSGMFDVAKASFFSQINTIPNFFSSEVFFVNSVISTFGVEDTLTPLLLNNNSRIFISLLPSISFGEV